MKRTIFTFWLGLFFIISALAQDSSGLVLKKTLTSMTVPPLVVKSIKQLHPSLQENALYPTIGDERKSFRNYLQARMEYPALAEDYGIEGSTLVRLEISKDGWIKKTSLTESIHPILEREVHRVIRTIPKINPAIVAGRYSDSTILVPIDFYIK